MKKIFYILTMMAFMIVFLSCGDDSTKPKDEIVLELLATKFYPSFNATEVSCDTDLEVTFNANVQPTAGNISIYESNGPVLHESFSISEDVIFEKNKIIIKPKKALKGKTSYFVTIDPISIQTSYGISYAGININNYWTFTTAEAPIDTTFNKMTADIIINMLEINKLDTFKFAPLADSIHFIQNSDPSRFTLSAQQNKLFYYKDDITIILEFLTDIELNKPTTNCLLLFMSSGIPTELEYAEVTLIKRNGGEFEGRFNGHMLSYSDKVTLEIKNGYFKVDLE